MDIEDNIFYAEVTSWQTCGLLYVFEIKLLASRKKELIDHMKSKTYYKIELYWDDSRRKSKIV